MTGQMFHGGEQITLGRSLTESGSLDVVVEADSRDGRTSARTRLAQSDFSESSTR